MIKNLFFGRKSNIPKMYSSKRSEDSFISDKGYSAVGEADMREYDGIINSIPIVDACINRIIRLMGEFEIEVQSQKGKNIIDEFFKNVRVGGSCTGIKQFVEGYMYDLLVYGNAVGEMIPDECGIGYLYNVPLGGVVISNNENVLEPKFYRLENMQMFPIKNPELVLFTPLNPKSGEIMGTSILSGCKMTAESLCQILRAIGKSFRRIGDLRYAVTYNPDGLLEASEAKEIAGDMAKSWSDTMSASDNMGTIRDFIAVGDVNVRTIGADSQFIETQEPARQLIEQLVAKLGIPPFILGLNWSTTERMSKQQADILTSELKNYRRIITPVIEKISRTHLQLNGCFDEPNIVWKNINLQDEVEIAKARLLTAQAEKTQQKEEIHIGE